MIQIWTVNCLIQSKTWIREDLIPKNKRGQYSGNNSICLNVSGITLQFYPILKGMAKK